MGAVCSHLQVFEHQSISVVFGGVVTFQQNYMVLLGTSLSGGLLQLSRAKASRRKRMLLHALQRLTATILSEFGGGSDGEQA
jgi:hypothetical protein